MRKNRNLSITEKVDISHKVLVLHESQTEVAREYRVTTSCVCHIIRKSRSNSKYLEELMAERDGKEAEKEMIK